MRQSVRALGWTVTISILLLSAFLITAAYSVVQTALVERGIELGRYQVSVSNRELVFSIPVKVNNTGWYDMTEFRLTTTLTDHEGAVLAKNTTTIDKVRWGSSREKVHSFSINVRNLLVNMTYLLFNDTAFSLDSSMGFRYAYALGFQIDVANMTVEWGAPLYNLNIKGAGQPTFNGTHLSIDVSLEFENHFFSDVTGVLYLKAYNQMGEYIGSGEGFIHVPAGSGLTGPIKVIISVEKPLKFTGGGYLEIYLETPIIDQRIELGRINYG